MSSIIFKYLSNLCHINVIIRVETLNIVELEQTLQNLNINATARSIAELWNMNEQSYSRKKRMGSEIKYKNIEQIEQRFNISLTKRDEQYNNVKEVSNTSTNSSREQVEIFYYDNLPSSWKHPSLTTFNFDREMLEDIWQRKRENVKVVAMAGDKMDGGQYPFKNRDILLIDTSATDLSKSGAFFFSSRNNKNYFLCNLDLKINGDVEFSYNNTKYEGRTISEEELKELDFKIIGRVFKNESFYL